MKRPRLAAQLRQPNPPDQRLEHSAASARRRGRRYRGALAVLLVLAALTPQAGSAGSAVAQPTPSTTKAASTTARAATPSTPTSTNLGRLVPSRPTSATVGVATTQLELRGQTSFVGPSDTFSLRLAAPAIEDGVVSFTLYRPITAPGTAARAALDDYVAGKTTGGTMGSPFQIPLSQLAANTDGTVTASFPIAPDARPEGGFVLTDPGVYPMTVSLRSPGLAQDLGRFTTFLVRLPASDLQGPPLDVATTVAFHAPVARNPDLTTSIEPTKLAHLQSIIAVLTKHRSTPLTIEPTPETVDALGRAVSLPTVESLATSVAGRQVLASTFVDVDVNAWVDASLSGELAAQLELGRAVLDDRLHLNPPAAHRTWLAAEGLSGGSLSQLHQLGVDQLIVTEASVAPLDRAQFDATQMQVAQAQPFEIETTGGRVRAATANDTLARRLTATDDSVLNAQIAIADLAVIYFGALQSTPNAPSQKRRGVVLTVPDDPRVVKALDAFLTALSTPSTGKGRAIVRPVTLDQLFAIDLATTPGSNAPVVRGYAPSISNRDAVTGFAAQLADVRLALAGFRAMVGLTRPDKATDVEGLLEVAGAKELGPNGRQAYLDSVYASVGSATAKILTPQQEQVTLTASETRLTIQVENQLDYPVWVDVGLSSDGKLEFPNGTTIRTPLAPGVNHISVDVLTRASGTFPVEVKVFTPGGDLDLAVSTFSVRSTAVSGLGLVLSIGAGVFLLVWWSRNMRSVRRAKKLVPAEAAGDVRSDPASGPTNPSPTSDSAGLSGESLHRGRGSAPVSRANR